MYFEIYQQTPGLLDIAAGSRVQWRWRLKSSNGKTVADSAEGYNNKADCLYGIGLVMDTNRLTPIREV